MTFVEVCRKVNDEGMMCFRPKAKDPLQHDVKDYGERKGKGWTLLDGMTASLCARVYDAVDEENRAKLDSLSALEFINLCWKLVKKQKEH